MRRTPVCKALVRAAFVFLCIYLAFRIGDWILSTIFATIFAPGNDGFFLPHVTCPPFRKVVTPGMTITKRDKILKDPSQFSVEDSNLPYIVESYRTSALAAKVVKLLTYPVDIPCRNLVRFGMTEPGGHDGHWVCIDVMHQQDETPSPSPEETNRCLVYSFGVGYDFSFEDQIIKRHCDVHSFDPSMMLLDHVRGEGVYFHRLGLANQDSDDYAPFLGGYIKEPQIWRVRTLESIISALGHEKNNISVLKVDVEGAEWALVEYLLFEKPQLLARIDQFIVEWHIGQRQQRQIDAIYQLATLFRKCAGFALVYADHWRRDSHMHAFLTTFVNSRLGLQNSF